ncbi:MAG: hypothetical protein ACM3JQ_06135 [Candidatus Eiseniibacteriota bacterium]
MASFSKEMTKNSRNKISDIADIAGMIVGCAVGFPHPEMWKP